MESSSPPDEELHARVRQQEVVTELGQEALETDDLDQLMRDASVAVAETLGNEYCEVLELLPNGDEGFLRQGVGWQDGLVGSATIPTDQDSQAGYTLHSEEPVIVDDLHTEERFSGPELLTSHDVVSGINVVVGSPDDPWGVLGTHTTEQREFTEHDANFVKSVANVLASAIENERTESELEEIYGRISDAFFALDEQWRFTHINERAHELINPEDKTLVGKHVWEEFPDAVEQQFKPKYERAMHEKETVAFEEYYPDPLDAWFEVRAYPSESGLSIYFHDVTERKRREQELQQTERQFEAIFEDPNILVGLLDLDGTVRDINQTAMEYIDADLDAVTGELFWETPWWGEGEDVRADVKEWTERAADGEYVDFEADLTRPDGQRYTLNGVFRPVTNDDGDVVSVVVSDRDVTERREYERQLEESEQRYRTLAESFPNGIVTLFDDDLRYTLAAGQGFEEIPVSPDDIEGRTPSEAWDDHVADALEPVLQATLDGERDAVELSYVDREWVIYAVPITDDSGDVFAGVTVAHDITDRKEAEAELKRVTAEAEEQKRFYETIISSTPDLVYAFDLDYRFTFANDAVLEMWGQSREESIGKTLREIGYEPWHAEMHEREIDEVIETKEPIRGEVEFPHVEHGRRVYEYIFAPVLDDDGEVEAIAGTSRDVTERRQAEEKLQQSKERFQALVTASSDVVYRMSPDWSEMHELEGKEFLADTDEPTSDWLDKYIHPDDQPRVMEAIDEAIQTKSTFELEHRVEQDDGSTGWTFSRAVPMLDGDGELEGWMGMASDITDRKERERELTKYETIVETIDDGIYVKDESGQFTMVNDAYAELTGYDCDELLGADVSLVVDEEAIREAQAVRSKTADGDRTMEAMVETADGDSVPAEATFATIQTVEGEEKQVGVVRDITERREQRRKLEESERRYRTLVEHFPNGAVGLFDEDLRYTAVGGQLVDETDVAPEKRTGQRVSEIYPDDIVDEVEPYFHAALDGETNSFEVEYHDRHLSAHTLPVRDGDGEVFAGMLVVQDVTERVEREAELERALDLLDKTERIADVGGWEIDMDTSDVFWTDHIFDLLEVTADEEPPLDEALGMYYEEDQQVVEDAIEEAMDSGDPFDVEVRLHTESGEMRWLRLQGAPETVDGEVVSLRGAAQDVTDRKQHEQQREELIDRLEESNERLEQFAYAASHDLQEPLRMVSSYLQLLETRYADELDEEADEYIEFAVDGADRMRDMIEGLLEYSRVDTRGDPFEAVDLDGVLADVREDLQVRIEESNAEITAESLPRVEGDEQQLRQVFQNLLDNAVEYSGDDPPRIDISAERNAEQWVVSVRDEGIGIDPEDADRVFEVFQSLHTPDDHPGTGIGLALCERIVERHGGDIWVDSEPGQGTTFSFTLPTAGDIDE